MVLVMGRSLWIAGETVMEKSYVEQRHGGYWIRGTGISLDSFVESKRDRRIGLVAFPMLEDGKWV